jgi:hypothetical protein
VGIDDAAQQPGTDSQLARRANQADAIPSAYTRRAQEQEHERHFIAKPNDLALDRFAGHPRDFDNRTDRRGKVGHGGRASHRFDNATGKPGGHGLVELVEHRILLSVWQ